MLPFDDVVNNGLIIAIHSVKKTSVDCKRRQNETAKLSYDWRSQLLTHPSTESDGKQVTVVTNNRRFGKRG
ncbi:hypothetical protein TNCV_987961 [Trichonephila clavipes]|nr:hypothetical protein TNCV_987961 [Trichonephila clavipes]